MLASSASPVLHTYLPCCYVCLHKTCVEEGIRRTGKQRCPMCRQSFDYRWVQDRGEKWVRDQDSVGPEASQSRKDRIAIAHTNITVFWMLLPVMVCYEFATSVAPRLLRDARYLSRAAYSRVFRVSLQGWAEVRKRVIKPVLLKSLDLGYWSLERVLGVCLAAHHVMMVFHRHMLRVYQYTAYFYQRHVAGLIDRVRSAMMFAVCHVVTNSEKSVP